jgi:hypothetical protein
MSKLSTMRTGRLALMLATVAALAACATPPPRVATPQDATVAGKPMKFGGSYAPKDRALTLTINDEPALRGSFGPYSPTLTLSGDYKGQAVRAECYFASVLSEKRGRVGIIASAIQGGTGKSSDTCKMFGGETEAATLNF